MSPPHPPTRLAAIGLVLAAALVPYVRTLGHGFVLDDERLLRSIPEIRSLQSVPAVLGLDGRLPQPRALRTVSFAIDHAAAGGFDPAYFHASNLVLHALAAIAVFALARKLLAPLEALLAALVFAVHPVQTEAVAFVAARKDLLAALFSTLAFLAFLRHRERQTAGRAAAVFGLFALAVLGKEVAVVLPALFLAHDAIARREGVSGALRTRWRFYAPFAALALAAAAVAVAFHEISSFAASLRFPGGSLARTWLTVPAVLSKYAALLFFPFGLSADYSYDAFPLVSRALDARFLVPLAVVAALAVLAAWLARRAPAASFGMAWALVAVLPVSQILPHHEIVAEHYLYLPSIGAALAAGCGLGAAVRRVGPAGARLAATILVLFAAASALRVRAWADEETLLRSAVARFPRCARARAGLGEECLKKGLAEEGVLNLEAASAIGAGPTPEESRGFVAAENRLALLAVERWRDEGSPPRSEDLERAFGGFGAAIAASPDEPGPRANLLHLAVLARRPEAAVAAARGAPAGAPLGAEAARGIAAIGALPGDAALASEAAALLSLAVASRTLSGADRTTALRLVESWLESHGDLPAWVAFSRWRGLAVKETQRRIRGRIARVPPHLPPSVDALRSLPPVDAGSAPADPPLDGPAVEAHVAHLSRAVLAMVQRGPRGVRPAADFAAAANVVRRSMRAWLGEPLPSDRDL